MNILITGCNGQLGNEMQLLEDKFISGFIRSQIGIAALALPQQLFDGKFFSVDR